MEKKDYENLIKEYEKLNKQRSDMYPLNFEDEIENLLILFSKEAFIQASSDKKLKVILVHMNDGNPLMKYYIAFKNHDMEALNNALYEATQLLQISNVSDPGADQGFFGMNITPNLLAANVMDRIKLVLPEENGFGKYSYDGTHIANLLMAIIYDNRDFRTEALALSEKVLSKKNTEFMKLYILCMRFILQKNCGTFNEQLENFCQGYMKRKDYGMNAFNKGFCIEAHAMYNLALYAFHGELRDHIKMPKATNFCQELAVYQKENDYTPGKVTYIYPQELDVCNKLMNCEPPMMNLVQEGKSNYIDVNRFLYDITSKLGV